MHLKLLSSRALAAVSVAMLAANAVAQPPQALILPASKSPDSALLEVGKGRIRGAVVATARADLADGSVALLVASVTRPKGPAAFELLVFGDADGAGAALLGSDELEGLSTHGTPTVALAAGAHRVAPGAVTATIGWKGDDGSAEERAYVYRFGAGRLTRLLAVPAAQTPPPGSARPSVRQAIEVLPTSSGGFNDLRVRTTTACSAPDVCAEDVEVTSYRFDGVRHEARPYPIPFLEKITASSQLSSRGGLIDYSAAAAVDGRLDTAWCEGEPGPGWFQKLELSFVPAQRLKSVSIVPGLGSGAAFREVTRPKRIRVLLPDGRKIEADLADEPKPQRIALPDGDRVFGMTLVILDVYKGKREDACISELDLEVEP
ncbi:MAG: discoidin domain-containing protein [Anaeromyxobacteraceae bacterium]